MTRRSSVLGSLSSNWFIDALDARAGLAFAARRQPDLSSAGMIAENDSMLFFSPPEFEAQALVSRGTAFASARGSFQLGLFLAEREVAFPTADAIAEFVRRIYLRSGGGDAPPIGGGPPLPPEPPLEADREPPSESALERKRIDTTTPADLLIKGARTMRDKAQAISIPGDSQPVPAENISDIWFATPGRPRGKLSLPDAMMTETLCSAVYHILKELCRDPPLTWSHTVRFLHILEAISIAKAFAFWLDERRQEELHAPKFLWHWLRYHQQHGRYYDWREYDYGWRRGYDYHPPQFTIWDPLYELGNLPIPQYLASGLATSGEADGRRPSLRNLTLALLGSPLELAKDVDSTQPRAELLFLSATIIAASSRNQTNMEWLSHGWEHAAALFAAEGAAWLAWNLPRLVFPDAIESLIKKSNTLAYTGNPDKLIQFVGA